MIQMRQAGLGVQILAPLPLRQMPHRAIEGHRPCLPAHPVTRRILAGPVLQDPYHALQGEQWQLVPLCLAGIQASA